MLASVLTEYNPSDPSKNWSALPVIWTVCHPKECVGFHPLDQPGKVAFCGLIILYSFPHPLSSPGP